jgi:hypothetical protein
MSSGSFMTPKSDVWGGVTALAIVKSGNCKKIKCNSCDKIFAGGSLRITEHYIKCYGTSEQLREWARQKKAVHDSVSKDKSIVKSMDALLEDAEDCEKEGTISKSMNKITTRTDLCHKAVSDWIFNTMQSFNDTEDNNFIKMIDTLIKFAPPGYKPPKPHLVRGKYLDRAYAKTKEALNQTFDALEHMCALTIMSDGKTNKSRNPIINFIAASAHGAHFLAAEDMSDKQKDNKKMAEYLHEKCVDTGKVKSFYMCVLDGALRSAFPHIEAKMPWITCIWCSCHIISLFFKDCFTGEKGLPELKEALEKVKKVIHFVRDRQKPLAIFRTYSTKELILPGKKYVYTIALLASLTV